ncbi:hypothetical protein BV20DRAFT_1049344 [Pilatotrama ljubarskyi]|nr:hypothetical protein BV20DRAFT_1049344 [Pilatotrama ljubarskyi]
MSRLSLFKLSQSSSKTSVDSTAPSRRSSVASDCSSPVLYVPLPGISPSRQTSFQSNDSRSSGSDYAEMMDDDNMAWGKPKKQSRR